LFGVSGIPFGRILRATDHGFRGTPSTILNEEEFSLNVFEMQLAHAELSILRM
jgi:hypothetical protein